jgi:NADPH:quinone reductase-like Zn-dependent oxidoreductase
MVIPDVMKGVQLVGHGGPEKLVWNEKIPTPNPKSGEVLVRVLAAGVNNTDINTRVGWYSKSVSGSTEETTANSDIEEGGWSGALNFPLIQGGDLCGEVVALGEGVEDVFIGMRVTCPTNQPNPTPESPTTFQTIGSEFDGAFAQYCKVPAKQLHDVTASPLRDVEIAALPCAHGTAFNLLTRSNVRKDDRVLITGASGGVGLAAVELAKLKGAIVTAICSKNKSDAVLDAGADKIVSREDKPDPKSFDVVIDVVGGDAWPALIEAIVPGGRYAASGAIAGPIVECDLRTIYLNDLTLYGCSFTPHEVFAGLVEHINAGRIRPRIAKTYELIDIAKAQEDFARKKYAGKLVLLPPAA